MNNLISQTLSKPDTQMEQNVQPVSYIDNTIQNTRPQPQQQAPQQLGVVPNNLLEQIKEQFKSHDIQKILNPSNQTYNGLIPQKPQNLGQSGKALEQPRPDAQVQFLLNQLNNIQNFNSNGPQFSAQNQITLNPEKNRQDIATENQAQVQNEQQNNTYKPILPTMSPIRNFNPQNGVQNQQSFNFPARQQQVQSVGNTLQNYKFTQNSNSNVMSRSKSPLEGNQVLQNNMQTNIQTLQALQQNIREQGRNQQVKNQDQMKINGDINLMNRAENQVSDNKQFGALNQNSQLQQVLQKSQNTDKKVTHQNNINQETININGFNFPELFKMNSHMINMPQSKALGGASTTATQMTADTRNSGNSLQVMQNKNQINTSFNGNLNFKKQRLEDIHNLLIQQQNNQDPQSSGQDSNNNNNHVQKWLEDNWATGSQFISQLQNMSNKNNQQQNLNQQPQAQAQQPMPQDGSQFLSQLQHMSNKNVQQPQQQNQAQDPHSIEDVITQTNMIQSRIQNTLEKLSGMQQPNQEIRFNNSVFDQNQGQSIRNMKNQFNTNINILLDLNQLQEENHKLLSTLFQQLSDKSIVCNPQQYLGRGSGEFQFNGNSPQEVSLPNPQVNKEQMMSSQIFMIVEKLQTFFKNNNSQNSDMNNEILQQLYKIHGTIQTLLQHQQDNRNDSNPNQQSTVGQLSILKNILDTMIREQVMHLNSIEKAPQVPNVNTSNGLIGFPQQDLMNQFQNQQQQQMQRMQQMPIVPQQAQIITQAQKQNIEPLVQKVQRLDEENRIQDNFQLFKQINMQNLQTQQSQQNLYQQQPVVQNLNPIQSNQQKQLDLMNLQQQIEDSDNNITSQDEKITSGAEQESKPMTSVDYSSMNEQDANFHKFFFPTDTEEKRDSDQQCPSSVANEQVKHNKKKTQIQYVLQTLQIIRSVIPEEEISFIKMKIEDVIKQNSTELDKVLIEANIPRKNHNSSDDNFRGSKYRGPSKNRKKWQVMKMIKKQTVRVGTVESELEAARIYDFLAILTEGLNAKTNFDYSTKQLHAIIQEFFYNDKINEHIKYFEGDRSLTQTQQSGAEENLTKLGKRNFSTFQNRNFNYVQNLQNNLKTLQQQNQNLNLNGSINQNVITKPELNLVANQPVSINGPEASQSQLNQVKDEQKQIELLNYLNNQITQITNNPKQ